MTFTAWDHPRVCGEHHMSAQPSDGSRGSSPRMRGTPLLEWNACQGTGIIPAYAGNTEGFRLGACCGRDHPRVCGEHIKVAWMNPQIAGSSPRMRGTHNNDTVAIYPGGIIPAYAGNTFRPIRKRFRTRDHPRVCGEHHASNPTLISLRGSSPRMRGTLDDDLRGHDHPGIIPAYAGNTLHVHDGKPSHWDHPRVCGEHTLSSEYA